MTLKHFLVLTVAAPVVFLVAVVMHNAISALTGVEEAVFFFLAVLGAPALFVIGVAGSLYFLLKRLRGA